MFCYFKLYAFYKNGNISSFILTAILFDCYDFDANILSNNINVSFNGSLPTNNFDIEFANLSKFLELNIYQSQNSRNIRTNYYITLFFSFMCATIWWYFTSMSGSIRGANGNIFIDFVILGTLLL